jgi:peptide/nickel transport system substrate-binding protein
MLPFPMLRFEGIYSHAGSALKAPIFVLILGLALHPSHGRAEPVPGLAMHGEPAEVSDFTHFSYANPDAPKGGTARFAKQGPYGTGL